MYGDHIPELKAFLSNSLVKNSSKEETKKRDHVGRKHFIFFPGLNKLRSPGGKVAICHLLKSYPGVQHKNKHCLQPSLCQVNNEMGMYGPITCNHGHTESDVNVCSAINLHTAGIFGTGMQDN